MNNKYVYRVLREEELYYDYLISKKYYSYYPYIDLVKYDEYFGKNALDKVFTHIRKGNKSTTPWISCTKNFDKATKRLYYDYNIKEITNIKKAISGIAIIKNHNQDDLKIKEYCKIPQDPQEIPSFLRNLNLEQIRKCVLDMSKGYSKLFDTFLKDNVVKYENGIYRHQQTEQEINYSRASEEVLILGEIPYKDYYILDPLQINIIELLIQQNIEIDNTLIENLQKQIFIRHKRLVYATIQKYDITYEDILSTSLTNIFNSMTEQEKNLFDKIYIQRENKYLYTREQQSIIENIAKMITDFFLENYDLENNQLKLSKSI